MFNGGEKMEIKTGMFTVIMLIIAITSLSLGYIMNEYNQPECEECAFTIEFAEQYLIDCKSVGIEGKPYTICEQKLIG